LLCEVERLLYVFDRQPERRVGDLVSRQANGIDLIAKDFAPAMHRYLVMLFESSVKVEAFDCSQILDG
jgi:hypothetical protein